MSSPPSLCDSSSQAPATDSRSRERISAALEKLAAAAPEINAASDDLMQSIGAIDGALQKLNVGISAWVPFAAVHDEDGDLLSTRSLGYDRVSGIWGIAIRHEGFDPDGDPTSVESWRFNHASRSDRLEALERLPELLEELAESASTAAAQLRSKVAKTKQVATTIGRITSATPARRK